MHLIVATAPCALPNAVTALKGTRQVSDRRCGGILGPAARSDETGRDRTQRGTVPADGVEAGVGSVAGLRQGRTFGHGAWSGETGRKPLRRGTVPAGRAEAGVGLAV